MIPYQRFSTESTMNHARIAPLWEPSLNFSCHAHRCL